jgi:hypothetical protein
VKIRAEQMYVFEQNERQKFQDWTVDHLRRFFPTQCAAVGEQGLRGIVLDGIERAAGHGVKSRVGICKYIDLMILLGREFETDPRFPSAANILRQPIPADTRISSLVNYVTGVLRGSVSRSAQP